MYAVGCTTSVRQWLFSIISSCLENQCFPSSWKPYITGGFLPSQLCLLVIKPLNSSNIQTECCKRGKQFTIVWVGFFYTSHWPELPPFSLRHLTFSLVTEVSITFLLFHMERLLTGIYFSPHPRKQVWEHLLNFRLAGWEFGVSASFPFHS